MRRILLALLFVACSVPAFADAITTRDFDTAFPRQQSGRDYYSEYDGCSGGVSSAGGEDWISSQSGTGATVSAVVPTDLSDACSVQIDLGTVATNDSGVRTQTAGFDLGNGELCVIAWIREVVISDDATSDFIARVGISNGDSAPTGFVGFRYNDDGVNGGVWEAVARSGSVETGTVFNTGITYTAGTSRWFKTCINAGATSATLWTSTTGPYNMTLVVTHASNVPTATDGVGVVVQRTLGTAASIPMNINFLAVEWKPTTARW